jgi:hypothetical protein
MLHIATTNSNIPLVINNLFESIKRNCSQDFILHVCNVHNSEWIPQEGCSLEIYTENNNQIKFYDFLPDSVHSSVRHSMALNYIKTILPQDELAIICDADIHMCKNFDKILVEEYQISNCSFIATENSNKNCSHLPHPTLFCGKMQTLTDYNVDFLAVPKIEKNHPGGIVRGKSETGHKLGKIPNWLHLIQKPQFTIFKKNTYAIFLQNNLIAFHFKSGRKFNGAPHFKEWIRLCRSSESLTLIP